MARPTSHQIHAVRKVLYKQSRLNQLEVHRENLDVLMNLNPDRPLSPKDDRNPAGSGPTWYLPANGKLNVGDGIRICQQIAATLREIRHDLSGVDFPAADKAHLMAAIEHFAASWDARGSAWAAPKNPDIEGVVSQITRHIDRSIREASHIQEYLEPREKVVP